MRFSILTLFPEFFDSPLKASLLGKAIASNLIQTDFVAIREHGEGRHRSVDDRPFGGGPGMVMMAQVLEKALTQAVGSSEALDVLEKSVQDVNKNSLNKAPAGTPWVIAFTPQGKPLTAARARELAQMPHVVLVCGHYEGMDERFQESFVHEEISVGDYVLTGGEPAALIVLDAVARFIPGVIGEAASVSSDTFEASSEEMSPGGLKGPSYTRPQEWRGRKVPDVLLSGNHGEIRKWRLQQSQARTQARRPALAKSTAKK